MLKALRDFILTIGILIAIGVVITLIPIISAVISGLGLLAVLGLIGSVIYAGFREINETSVKTKDKD